MPNSKRNFLFFLLLFSCRLVLGQSSTIGKEFWVGFMENFGTEEGLHNDAVIIITADEKTSGAIEYMGHSASFDLEKGEQYVLRVNTGDLDLLHRKSGVVENKGVFISASGNIAVHAMNEMVRTADGTVVLPINVLGKDYYITTHKEVAPFSSTLLVVAIENNTEIEITTSVNSISGNKAGIPLLIKLNRGQSYQIKSDGDLTGSHIRVVGGNVGDCKKIAVFGGSRCTWVGDCDACDVLFQQAYPVGSWGKSFVHIALKERTSGEMVKVLASEDDTQVKVNGEDKGSINKGQYITLDFEPDESSKIETSKPTSVTVFSRGVGCNDAQIPELAGIGDPFMITYSPSEQFLKELTFNSLKLPSISNHYVNIVVKSGDQNKTILDGRNIGSSFSPLPGDTDFWIARINVPEGVHHLVNSEGFAAYLYGFGFRESYGYAAGASLDNLNMDIEYDYPFEVIGDKIACLDQEGVWSINTNNSNFTYFEWDFGDGSPLKIGQEVLHTYATPGKYNIRVTAAISPNSCDGQEEAFFETEVLETNAKLIGNTSVCPDVEQIMYYVEDKQHIGKVEYEAIGGEVLETYGDSVLVRWGEANPNAKLILRPFSINGCPGNLIQLDVQINSILDVSAPIGPKEVCYDPEVVHVYEIIAPVSGRSFQWEVIGGFIASGQGTSRIEVIWNHPNIIGEVHYVAIGPEGDSCSGTSPSINVKVADRLADVLVTDVECSGENTGRIELNLTDENLIYSFFWEHDPNLSGAIAENLKAGYYTVIVKEEEGCSQTIKGIEVKEHIPQIRMPTGFDPRQVSGFEGVSKCDVAFELKIYSRWGELIYSGSESWDGKMNGKEAPLGKYIYLIKYNYSYHETLHVKEEKGSFTLIR
ncbi:gliding motility-associated C-terminal domain-containing protein [Echinicola sp. CAU 1574]|uniref:Gliding motility-associated C-terminal domain-containing protein n=1 Tax=Echinicola arenosa TaxID=2774144 RepID=A0ABR9AGS7_9BACT|nr:PKD domain-containing protein [Echinicola arenosa]MBD8487973.1 gliding motility-associated C-terminal domain-containing protein [Echinicola arenosa]